MITTFIGQGFVSAKTCENLIELFKKSPEKYPGTVWKKDIDKQVDFKEKISTECKYSIVDPALSDYAEELQNVLENYMIEFPYSNSYSAFTIKENVKIQYYRPGEGFLTFHTERGNASLVNSTRHLVFMTYLNTVKDGGGTEFYHQNFISNAEQGKTLIWPADWTHTHRGVVSPTEEKYIITGWYSFI